VSRNVFSRGTAAVIGGVLVAGLMASSATAATSAPSAAATTVKAATLARVAATQPTRGSLAVSAHTGQASPALTPAQQGLLAARRALTSQLTGGGSITGVARAQGAAPLGGICVTATGPSGRRLAMTRQDGRFFISGLRAGRYSLQYRACANPGRYVPQWYGGTMTRAGSTSVLVPGVGLTPVAPVTLRPPVLPAAQPGLGTTPIELARSLLARVRGVRAGAPAGQPAARTVGQPASLALASGGQISGRVTDQGGHPLAGICVVALQYNGPAQTQVRTGLRGLYTTAKLPPGRYIAFFFAGCGNSGNWVAQIYKDTDNPLKATLITVKAGKTTGNIDAKLRLGGEISGTVTNAAGAKLSNICVFALAASNALQYPLIVPSVSRDGTYHVRGVPAGSYLLNFTPCNPGSPYTSVWWKNSATPDHARVIRVKDRQLISHIDQVIPFGAKITGVVTDQGGHPLAGICVIAAPAGGSGQFSAAATRADGTYVLQGLPAGSYQVQFSPGCPNNGNYLPENYPGNVTVAAGQVKAGIDGVLPPGAQISGVVTDSRGHPIAGICVSVFGGPGDNYGNLTQTAANGSYSVNQLAAGKYTIQFSGGCGNSGSYAPQGYNDTNVNTPQEVPVAAAQLLSGIDAVMQPGATIGGRVTSTSGKPLDGVCVSAVTPGAADTYGLSFIGGGGPVSAGPLGLGFGVSVGGRYQISNLQPGQYEVAFAGGCGSKGDLVAQWYSARRGAGPPVIISAGSGHPTADIDVVLQPGGAISGTIRSATGHHLTGACVLVTDLNRNVDLPVNEAFAFGSSYQLSGLPPGAYHVTFIPACFPGTNYATQWYSGKASPAGAARVIVRAGHTTAGIDSALTVGGSISGLVTSAAATPLRNICVFAQNVAQFEDYGFGFSNRQGRYVIGGLNSGQYDVQFFPCFGASSLAGQDRPSLVTVSAPRQTGGINAAMTIGGSIQGQVTSGSPAAPGQALCVDAFSVNSRFANTAITDAVGDFSIPNLPAGQYKVYFGDPACPFGPYNVVPQWYAGQSSPARATPVTVTGGKVTSGVDANLALDGSITGTVTGPSGEALTGVCVAAFPTGGGTTPVIAVTAKGGYAITELTPGHYRVEFFSGCGAVGYVTQWWRNAASAGTATIVTVTAASTVTGISAALRK
jgi:Carboxypeptidase regulatory-like domain